MLCCWRMLGENRRFDRECNLPLRCGDNQWEEREFEGMRECVKGDRKKLV